MKKYDVKQSRAGGWLGVCLAFLLAACSDDFHLTAEVTQPGEPLLEQDLQPYGYTLPLQITTNGDWRIELDEAGEKIAYACPEQGTGDAVVKICILDNLDETARSGQLTVVFPQDERKNHTLRLHQLSASGGDSNFDTRQLGQLRLGVGYGIDVGKGVTGRNALRTPLLKLEVLREAGNVVEDGSFFSLTSRVYTGSTVQKLSEDYENAMGISGSYIGIRAEADASFNKSDYHQSQYEFALSYVDVRQQRILIDLSPDLWLEMDMLTDGARKALLGEDPYYASTDEGFAHLVQAYGTHVVKAATLGGRLRVATQVDVTQVNGSYDMEAFARLSYAGAINVKDDDTVTKDYRSSYAANRAACTSKVQAWGGRQEDVDAIYGLLGTEMETAVRQWVNGLSEDESSWTCVGIDEADDLVPLYELMLDVDPGRAKAFKDYLERRVYTGDRPDLWGSQVYVKDLPSFGEEGTLVYELKDTDGNLVGCVCEELVPPIDRYQRVKVIYPAVDGQPLYGLGYFPGSGALPPMRVVTTANGVTAHALSRAEKDAGSGFYLRGGSVSVTGFGHDVEVVEAEVQPLEPVLKRRNGTSRYPVLKLGQLLLLREDYEGYPKYLYDCLEEESGVYYAIDRMSSAFEAGWTVPTSEQLETVLGEMPQYATSPTEFWQQDVAGLRLVPKGYWMSYGSSSPQWKEEGLVCLGVSDDWKKWSMNEWQYPYYSIDLSVPSFTGKLQYLPLNLEHQRGFVPLRLCQVLVKE